MRNPIKLSQVCIQYIIHTYVFILYIHSYIIILYYMYIYETCMYGR